MYSSRYYIYAIYFFLISSRCLVASSAAKEALTSENQNEVLPTSTDILSKNRFESADYVSQKLRGEQSNRHHVQRQLDLNNRRKGRLDHKRSMTEYYVDDALAANNTYGVNSADDDDFATFEEPSYFYDEYDVDSDLYYNIAGRKPLNEYLSDFTTFVNQNPPFGLAITTDQMLFILGLSLVVIPFVLAYLLSKLPKREREDDFSKYGLMYNPSDYTYEWA